MDVLEQQSSAPPWRWKAFHFSTLVVCVLGVLGNTSSLVVLKLNIKEIAGSRLLFALAVADLGVVSAIAFRTLSYVIYDNGQVTQVLEWLYLYWCYCSAYLTVLLGLDRYLHSAKSMLLRKIDYKKILRRSIIAVFASMLVISLPHLLGTCVHYFHGSHLVRSRSCLKDQDGFCNRSIASSRWEIHMCDDAHNSAPKTQNLSYSELGEHQRFVDTLCGNHSTSRLSCWGYCACHLDSLSPVKFTPTYRVDIHVDYSGGCQLHICRTAKKAMRYDPEFVKAVYLGLDLPIRYIIPCCVLVFINICLVVSVFRAKKRHSNMTGKSVSSLLNLPIFWSVVCIVLVFLGCHTAGVGLFVKDLYSVFGDPRGVENAINLYLDENFATTLGLEMKAVAFLLPAVNSTINIFLYYLFLPVFRKEWSLLFVPKMISVSVMRLRRVSPACFPVRSFADYRKRRDKTKQNKTIRPGSTRKGRNQEANYLAPTDKMTSANTKTKVVVQPSAGSAPAKQSGLPARKRRSSSRWCPDTQRCSRLLVVSVGIVFLCVLVWTSVSMWAVKKYIDYDEIKPVRHIRMQRNIFGICISGPWLLATGWYGISLYSLPDLQPNHQLKLPHCRQPRTDRDGMVYVPTDRHIAVLKISDSGNMIEVRNLTSVGGQSLGFPFIAIGPQPGQLLVAQLYPPRLWVINITDSSLLHPLTLPDQVVTMLSVAALDSGHIMISSYLAGTGRWTSGLAVYRSATDSPTLLANMTSVEDYVSGLTTMGNHFLAPYCLHGNLLVLNATGSVLQTIDTSKWNLETFLYGVIDVAGWEDWNCFWLATVHGDLVLLC